jgi:hypothetical protein
MATNNHSQLAVSSLSGARSYILQGEIGFIDDQGAPHHFGLRVVAESKQAAERYVAYLTSDQYPHTGWMAEQTALADGTGTWVPLPGAEAGTAQPGPGILAAFIQPAELADNEIDIHVELNPWETKSIPVKTKEPCYTIQIHVRAGGVKTSIRKGGDTLTGTYKDTDKLEERKVPGIFSGTTDVEAEAADAMRTEFAIKTFKALCP